MLLTQFSMCLIAVIILSDPVTGQNSWNCTASGSIFDSDGVECRSRHPFYRPDFHSFIQLLWTNFEVSFQIITLPLVPKYIQFGVH